MLVSRGTRRRGGRDRRPGAILVVVLALLALFAVVGLSFLLYAESAATAARIHRESNTREFREPPPPDPAPAAAGFLRQLIFPVGDYGPDTTTVLRGHDLARLMYGNDPAGDNTTPYNGTGLFHEALNLPGVGPLDRAEVVNFTYRRDR